MPDEPTRSSALSADDIAMYPELATYPMVLTIREVADLLRVSHEAVRRRCHDGSIRSIRFGIRLLIPRHELLRLLREI